LLLRRSRRFARTLGSIAGRCGTQQAVSVLPDTGGPQWVALAGGVLLVGVLLRRRIR
jgi:LPXTG-motif cell wall-anchored protein